MAGELNLGGPHRGGNFPNGEQVAADGLPARPSPEASISSRLRALRLASYTCVRNMALSMATVIFRYTSRSVYLPVFDSEALERFPFCRRYVSAASSCEVLLAELGDS